MLSLNGLEPSEIQTKNILVGSHEGEDIFIRTYIFDANKSCETSLLKSTSKEVNVDEISVEIQKPTLVLVHGFASCSTILGLKVSRLLAHKFKLILVDLIGMGGSSRPNDYNKHKLLPEQSTQYFVEYLEKWR